MKAKKFKKLDVRVDLKTSVHTEQHDIEDAFKVGAHGGYYSVKIDCDFLVKDRNNSIVIFDKRIEANVHGWVQKEVFNNLNIVEPVGNDKSFYRHKKLTLPRDKFAVLKDKYNWSITRNPDKADYHVVSKKLLNDGVLQYTYQNRGMRNEEFKNFIMHAYNKDIITQKSKDSLMAIYRPEEDVLYEVNTYGPWHRYKNSNPHYARAIEQTVNKFSDAVDDFQEKTSESDLYKCLDENGNEEVYYAELGVNIVNQDSFDILFNNLTTNFVYDTHLVDKTNEDNPVLTKDDFDIIQELLSSKSREDITMGLNVLANCNISKSLDIVAYFFTFYWDILMSANTWNSVVVKSMRGHLSDVEKVAGRMGNHSWSYDYLIRYLAKNDSLSEFIFNKIAGNVFNKFTAQFFGDQTVFEIPEIELKPELKAALKFDYIQDPIKVDLRVQQDADLPF